MPAADAGQAFATVLVDELVRHGVTDAVVAPGSRSTPVVLALLADDRVRVHVRIDERSAAYLALGIAKADERIVAVLCTSGTATSYLLGAVMEADQARVPLLVLTADRPSELRGVGANQTVDQVGMYGAAVRWACDVGVPETLPDSVRYWRSTVSRAAAHCLGAAGAPGPVHLNLALREPLVPRPDATEFRYDLDGQDAPDSSDPSPRPAWSPSRPWTSSVRGRAAAPDELVRRLQSARRGVVVAGDCHTHLVDGIAQLAERAGWPLIAEPHSGARTGANALRATDALLRDDAFTAANRPDLVVVAGRVGLSRALLGWLATLPHVVVDPDGSWWDVTRTAEAVLACSYSALGDVAVTPAPPDWLATWRSGSDTVGAAIDAELDVQPTLTEPQVARDVAELLPGGATLVVASSMPIRDLDLVMRPRHGLRVMANRGVSGIDGLVSTAQGVALSRGIDGPVVALCGDLSLLHDVNGLLPGPDRRPDVTYVVVNNDGGGIFSTLPQGSAVATADFERVFGTPHGMSLQRLAAAYDVGYERVSSRAELAGALAVLDGLRIVEVRTERSTNAALHERLRDVAAAAVPHIAPQDGAVLRDRGRG